MKHTPEVLPITRPPLERLLRQCYADTYWRFSGTSMKYTEVCYTVCLFMCVLCVCIIHGSVFQSVVAKLVFIIIYIPISCHCMCCTHLFIFWLIPDIMLLYLERPENVHT